MKFADKKINKNSHLKRAGIGTIGYKQTSTVFVDRKIFQSQVAMMIEYIWEE